MKKRNPFLKALFCCLILGAACVPVACDNDDDDNTPVPEVDDSPKVYSATVDYKFYVSQDLLNIAYVYVDYIDNRQVKREQLTSTTWEKTGHVSGVSGVPGELGYTVLATQKPTYNAEKEIYTISYSNTTNAAGQAVSAPFVSLFQEDGTAFPGNGYTANTVNESFTVEGGKVLKTLEELQTKPLYNFHCQVTREGKVSKN